MKTTEELEDLFRHCKTPMFGDAEYFHMLPRKTGFIAGYRAAEKDSATRIIELEKKLFCAEGDKAVLSDVVIPHHVKVTAELSAEVERLEAAVEELVAVLKNHHDTLTDISDQMPAYYYKHNSETCTVCALIAKYRKDGGV